MLPLSPEDIAWPLLLFIVVPLIWIVGLIRLGSRPKPLLIWSALIAAFYVSYYIALSAGDYTLTVQILDSERHPIPGLTASYFTFPSSDRFGRYSERLEGEVTTTASGQIVLRPNHAHTISFTIRDPRFQGTGFQWEAAGRHWGHRLSSNENLTFIQPLVPPPAQFSRPIEFDAQPQHSIVIALKPK